MAARRPALTDLPLLRLRRRTIAVALAASFVTLSGLAAAQEPLAPVPFAPGSAQPPASAQPPSAQPPSAQPSTPTSRASSTNGDRDEDEREASSYFGIGGTYAGAITSDVGAPASVDSYGVVLEMGKNFPLVDRFDLGIRGAWGLTAWDRFDRWAKAGYDIGSWTTEAYADVYDWTRKHSGDPNTHGLRVTASIFPFITLWIGYVVAGLAYVVAVVSPTTYFEGDFTVNYNLAAAGPRDRLTPYVKLGAGLFAFVHPNENTLRGGIGPTAGIGLRVSGLHLGANGTFSPPALHGEPRDVGESSIWIASLTVGFAR